MNSKITIFFLILTNTMITSILILLPRDYAGMLLVGVGGIFTAIVGGAALLFSVLTFEILYFFANFFITYFFLKLVMKILFKLNFLQRDDVPARFIVLTSIVVSLINQTSIFQQGQDLIVLYDKLQQFI